MLQPWKSSCTAVLRNSKIHPLWLVTYLTTASSKFWASLYFCWAWVFRSTPSQRLRTPYVAIIRTWNNRIKQLCRRCSTDVVIIVINFDVIKKHMCHADLAIVWIHAIYDSKWSHPCSHDVLTSCWQDTVIKVGTVRRISRFYLPMY